MAKPIIEKKIAENEIIKLIEQNQPISIYALRKKTNYLSYSGVRYYVKELEEQGKVHTTTRINENNKIERVAFLGTIEIPGTIATRGAI